MSGLSSHRGGFGGDALVPPAIAHVPPGFGVVPFAARPVVVALAALERMRVLPSPQPPPDPRTAVNVLCDITSALLPKIS